MLPPRFLVSRRGIQSAILLVGRVEHMMYTCPVCGFDKMPFPPTDHNICSCCGTEFGYHDRVRTPQSLRKAWIENGHRWFSTATMTIYLKSGSFEPRSFTLMVRTAPFASGCYAAERPGGRSRTRASAPQEMANLRWLLRSRTDHKKRWSVLPNVAARHSLLKIRPKIPFFFLGSCDGASLSAG